MIKKPKAHFAKLGSNEMQDLFELLVKQQIDITLWQKKTDFQEFARAVDLNFSKNALTLKGLGVRKMKDNEVLLNFRYANRMYFSTGQLTEVNDNIVLTFSSDIFKCEQRRNFRLPTTSTRKIEITIDGQKYDAIDVSVTGIGIIASVEQCTQLKVASGYDNPLLQIGDRQFNIPFCKIIHLRDYFADSKQKIVGIEFIEISRALEIELYRTINHLLYQELKG